MDYYKYVMFHNRLNNTTLNLSLALFLNFVLTLLTRNTLLILTELLNKYLLNLYHLI